MTQAPVMAKHLQLIATHPGTSERPVGLLKFMDLLGIAHTASGSWIEKFPFAPADTTAGTETELQTVVVGPRHAVDLPRSIEDSRFYRNINKHAATGDTPRKIVTALESYLDSPEQTWENSWVRFPRRVLNAYAGSVFRSDMRADKPMAASPLRCDADRFACLENGEEMLRIPVSYLLKLAQRGQKVIAYFGPHPPVRQRMLNDLIPDVFYRELFMSPCLSGWHCGEEKHRYMALCHEVLSRSQLNALGKLKEAGIIANNLVVLPNTSNISLANNGTHLSLGSRVLTGLMADPGSGYGELEEKYYGDLVIKICEHFLPLFVGTYSAAPYRFDFRDFHPERLLGFLPHELDYTHLRMIWRRWKRKAAIKFFGHAMTPFGPDG